MLIKTFESQMVGVRVLLSMGQRKWCLLPAQTVLSYYVCQRWPLIWMLCCLKQECHHHVTMVCHSFTLPSGAVLSLVFLRVPRSMCRKLEVNLAKISMGSRVGCARCLAFTNSLLFSSTAVHYTTYCPNTNSTTLCTGLTGMHITLSQNTFICSSCVSSQLMRNPNKNLTTLDIWYPVCP